MNDLQLHRIDLNLLVVFEVLMDERSVARAAERLGKTPSAVSHALGRLRDQVGDPLLVRVGGRMKPSPFAETLIEEVRPVLRTIRRIVQPPKPFDPATSERVFRIASPPVPALVSDVATRVHNVAPNVCVEWIAPRPDAYAQVVEGTVDLALGTIETVPEGAMSKVLPPIRRFTFARKDHPALNAWDTRAWSRWPHIIVGMSNSARQTVNVSVAKTDVKRRIGAQIPEFSGVAPLIASTNMLSNNIVPLLIDDIPRYGLRILTPPVDLPDLTFRFIWNARTANDPVHLWFRTLVMSSYDDLIKRSDAFVSTAHVVQPVRP